MAEQALEEEEDESARERANNIRLEDKIMNEIVQNQDQTNHLQPNSSQPVVGILKKTSSIRSKLDGRSSLGKDTTNKVNQHPTSEIKEQRNESSLSYEDHLKNQGTVTSSGNNTAAAKGITIVNNATKKTVTIAPLPFSF